MSLGGGGRFDHRDEILELRFERLERLHGQRATRDGAQVAALAMLVHLLTRALDRVLLIVEEVLHEHDQIDFAALIDAIVADWRLQESIVDGQLAAIERLRAKDFAGTLVGFVERILSSPRARPPHVAFDFWEQFDAAERLEELRLIRPSIFKALPSCSLAPALDAEKEPVVS